MIAGRGPDWSVHVVHKDQESLDPDGDDKTDGENDIFKDNFYMDSVDRCYNVKYKPKKV
jgi:hypothetical protein